MKRSTRSVAVSQAFKVIDSESRKDIRDRRLDALEADNFIEEQTETNAEDFEEDDDDYKGQAKRKRSSTKKDTKLHSTWSKRAVKTFERLMFEQGFSSESTEPNYQSVTVGPPRTRCTQLCSVCGYIGSYCCSRCGMRFCSNRCQQHHKETRCMKLSL